MKSSIIKSKVLPKRRWLAHAMTAALLAASAFTVTPQAQARLLVSVDVAPPLLPIYDQPPIPGPGYIWTPGYWAYDDIYGYYWVPGTWVRAPYVGALWTPGYWGWDGNAYAYFPGYWSDTVGYYGGIDYGYGYFGTSYYGGYWNNGGFYYNTAFNRLGEVPIATVYSKPVVVTNVSRVSFNGPTGVTRQPTAAELANSRHGQHMAAVSAQVQQQTMASQTASLRASVNHGKPPILATSRAGEFSTSGASAQQTTSVQTNAAGRHESTRVSSSSKERTVVGTSTGTDRRNQSSNRTNDARLHAAVATRPTHESRNSVRLENRQSIQSRPLVQHREPVVHESTHARASSSYGPAPNRMQQVQRQERSSETPIMRSDMRANGDIRSDTAPAPRRGERRPPDTKPKSRDHGGN